MKSCRTPDPPELAKSVIGGLLAATLLTLFVVPTMYTFFAQKVYRARAQTQASMPAVRAAADDGGAP